MNNSRARAAQVLNALIQGRGSLTTHLGAEDDALTRELCFGSCRWYYRLAPCLTALMDKPLKDRDGDVHALLIIGLYQMLFMRIPAHAAVNETVTATGALKKQWARKLVNGVLRNFQRQQAELLPRICLEPEAEHAHPQWQIDALSRAWPQQWQQILEANNLHPPMTLRNNRQQQTRDEYLQLLADAAIDAQPGALSPDAIYLTKPMDVRELPGFAEGRVSVQDEASQQVAHLLALQPGHRVLDACAAPGGKTSHMLELEPMLDVLALDLEPRRVRRIQENLTRLGLSADVRDADATRVDDWWDGQTFDRILLDAPCTATGIIRRQPDIKLLRKEDDVARMADLQNRLLDALWPCVKPGGLLLYTTCSVLPAENHLQMTAFLDCHADASAEHVSAHGGFETSPGYQLLPSATGPDGFYYALIRKTP